MTQAVDNDMPAQRGPRVKCPTCGRDAPYDSGNPFRPFCSERCRLIDLGAWADESYRIPESTPRDGALPLDHDD